MEGSGELRNLRASSLSRLPAFPSNGISLAALRSFREVHKDLLVSTTTTQVARRERGVDGSMGRWGRGRVKGEVWGVGRGVWRVAPVAWHLARLSDCLLMLNDRRRARISSWS